MITFDILYSKYIMYHLIEGSCDRVTDVLLVSALQLLPEPENGNDDFLSADPYPSDWDRS